MSEEMQTPFEEWCILELFGHRRLAGLVREVQVAGAGFLRLDVYEFGLEQPTATQFYSPSSVYAITPTSEELARRFAAQHLPRPVERWELPAGEIERSVRETVERDPDDRDDLGF